MAVIMSFLLVGGFLAALLGVAMLSEATRGVGLIAVGCFFGIVARIAQASMHAPSPPAPMIQCVDCQHMAPRGPASCPKCSHVYGTPRKQP